VAILTPAALGFLLLGPPRPHRRAVERALLRAGPDQLAAEAERLWEANGGPDGAFATIAEADWPEAFRAFRPQAVRVDSRGVTLRTRSRFVEESGLFYLPLRSRFQPPARGDPSFRPMVGRSYFYDIKG
jgi:hypothetical protein